MSKAKSSESDQLPSAVMYIIEKEGVYLRGVFWMGSDLDEAKKKADDFAALDSDDYHNWRVREFREIPLGNAGIDAGHNTVYTTRKGG